MGYHPKREKPPRKFTRLELSEGLWVHCKVTPVSKSALRAEWPKHGISVEETNIIIGLAEAKGAKFKE